MWGGIRGIVLLVLGRERVGGMEGWAPELAGMGSDSVGVDVLFPRR
jgi:hypothetical protein